MLEEGVSITEDVLLVRVWEVGIVYGRAAYM